MVDHKAIDQWTDNNWLEVVLNRISTPSVREAITMFPPANLEEGEDNPFAGMERHFAELLGTKFTTLIVPSKMPALGKDIIVKLKNPDFSGKLSLEIMWPVNRKIMGEEVLKSKTFNDLAYHSSCSDVKAITNSNPPSVGFEMTGIHPEHLIKDCNSVLKELHKFTDTTLPLDTILLDPYEFKLEGKGR
jgi:hypothetical protein